MVIVYLFASLVGALTTFTLLSSHGWLVALLCAPLGGSALTLMIAVLVVWSQRAPAPTAAYGCKPVPM